VRRSAKDATKSLLRSASPCLISAISDGGMAVAVEAVAEVVIDPGFLTGVVLASNRFFKFRKMGYLKSGYWYFDYVSLTHARCRVAKVGNVA